MPAVRCLRVNGLICRGMKDHGRAMETWSKAEKNYFMEGTPRSLQIFFASWSLISLCLGTADCLLS